MTLPPGVPELADLDLLLSVARWGSLGKAARAHGISQPAASARMHFVERKLGMQLLERSPSGSRLSADGATVAQWAQTVVDAAAELHAGAAALRNAEHGWLHVAASLTVAEYLMPGWMATLQTRLPQVTVTLNAHNSREVIERVRSGETALGFVEDLSRHSELEQRVVAEDELAVVVAPEHPWARLSTPLSPSQLAAGQLVLREHGSGTRETLFRVLGDLHEDEKVAHLECSSTTAIKEAVAAGAGTAVLSILAVTHELNEGQLVRVPVVDMELSRQLRAVWRKDTTLVEPAMALLEIAARGSRGPEPQRELSGLARPVRALTEPGKDGARIV